MTLLEQVLTMKQGKHLGDLCGWSLHGKHDRLTIEVIAAQHGIDNDLTLPRISPPNAYRRAIVEACRDAAREDDRGWIATVVESSQGYIVHEITRREIQSGANSTMTDNRAVFSTSTRTRFHRAAYSPTAPALGLMEVEDPTHPIAQRAVAIYEEYLSFIRADDIRQGFQRAFTAWAGVRVLDHGGLWLVPATFADKVRAWQTFIAEIGCSSIVIPVVDTDQAVASIKQVAEDSFEQQLAGLVEDLAAFAAKDNTRLSTLEARLETFDSLRSRVELYERLLGSTMGDLGARLVAAHDALASSISSLT